MLSTAGTSTKALTKKEMKQILAAHKLQKKGIKALANKCIQKIKAYILKKKETMPEGDDLDILVDSKNVFAYSYNDFERGNHQTNSFHTIQSNTAEGEAPKLDIISIGITQYDTDPVRPFTTTLTVGSEEDINESFIIPICHDDNIIFGAIPL
jgi:hypothetical protein